MIFENILLSPTLNLILNKLNCIKICPIKILCLKIDKYVSYKTCLNITFIFKQQPAV